VSAVNPSFDLDYAEAKRQLKAMEAQPTPLERPLVFVGPFIDPGLAEWRVLGQARRVFSNDQRMAGVSFVLWDDFDSCREKLMRRVEALIPDSTSSATGEGLEVDVIAFSMGGLVARYAAMPPQTERGHAGRLKVRRLFTIATPHRGATLAPLGWIFPLARQMSPGSAFLEKLDAALPEADYELIPYTRLGDWVVGAGNTAPPTMRPYWVPTRWNELAHVQAADDPRILADIFRRLRHEPALSAAEPGALP
jgi:pimeloyl-ACP methyl ester carboxylesterase